VSWCAETRTPTPATTVGRPAGAAPATRRHRQPRSQVMPSGTASWRQTTDSSSAVRVIEKKLPAVAHAGMAAVTSSLQMAKVSGRVLSVNE
jgi:hypothetical protein